VGGQIAGSRKCRVRDRPFENSRREQLLTFDTRGEPCMQLVVIVRRLQQREHVAMTLLQSLCREQKPRLHTRVVVALCSVTPRMSLVFRAWRGGVWKMVSCWGSAPQCNQRIKRFRKCLIYCSSTWKAMVCGLGDVRRLCFKEPVVARDGWSERP
jgi:hypothetical protein